MQFTTSTSILIAVCVLFGTGTYGQDFNAIAEHAKYLERTIPKTAGPQYSSGIPEPSFQNFEMNSFSGTSQNSGVGISNGKEAFWKKDQKRLMNEAKNSGQNEYIYNGQKMDKSTFCSQASATSRANAGC
jgi:hypothetical protein